MERPPSVGIEEALFRPGTRQQSSFAFLGVVGEDGPTLGTDSAIGEGARLKSFREGEGDVGAVLGRAGSLSIEGDFQDVALAFFDHELTGEVIENFGKVGDPERLPLSLGLENAIGKSGELGERGIGSENGGLSSAGVGIIIQSSDIGFNPYPREESMERVLFDFEEESRVVEDGPVVVVDNEG
ncbi:hypothetical protein MPER_02392, partial [Moniliophthora perniciosa FA553]